MQWAEASSTNKKTEDEAIETFRILYGYGKADTSLIDIDGRNLLDAIGLEAERTHGVFWLLQQEWIDVDVNHLNRGQTPLMNLAFGTKNERERIPLLNLLIDKGVDIDARKSSIRVYKDCGYTALHFSMRYLCAAPSCCFHLIPLEFSCRIAAHLLRRGANPHIVNDQGNTVTAMALASGTMVFRFWQQLVHAFKDVQDFVRKEMQQPSSLHDEGWNERSLQRVFNCDLATYVSNCDGQCSLEYDHFWSISTVDRRTEPWWFELQKLIKSGENPLPPLPRGWQKIRSNDGKNKYVDTTLGTATKERPKEAFFANLQSRKARKLYRKGIIRIEVEGCETEQDDWYSDRTELGLEDSDETESEESEGIRIDQYEEELSRRNGSDMNDDEEKEPGKEDPGESEEDEEFHDTQATPLLVLDGQ